MSDRIDWASLPVRAEDPCTQTVEYFFQEDVSSELLSVMLTGLSRQGFGDIEYEVSNEPDPSYQVQKYTVSANRRVCHCASVSGGDQVEFVQPKKEPPKKRGSKSPKDGKTGS